MKAKAVAAMAQTARTTATMNSVRLGARSQMRPGGGAGTGAAGLGAVCAEAS